MKVATLLLPFLTYFNLFNTIGPELMGGLIFTLSVIAFFRVMIKFGFEISAVRDIASKKTNPDKLITIVIFIQLLLFVFGVFILSSIGFVTEKTSTEWPLYLPAYLIILTEIISVEWFFNGTQKMHHLTIRIIIIELLTLVLTLLLINNPHDYTIFLFIKLFSYSFGAGYTSYILLKEFKYSPKKIHFNEVKNTFNDSKSFFLSRAFAVLHNEIAIILIGGYLTAKDIAYFDLARKVLSVFLIPNSIINTVAFPLLSKTKNIQLGKKIFLIRNILSIMLVAILLFGAPYFIAVLAPNPSPEVIQYVRLISILIFIRGVIYYTGISILVPFGYDSIFNKSVIYAVIIYLSLAYSLILLSIFSIITIISVMIVSEAFQAFYRYYYCKQHSLL